MRPPAAQRSLPAPPYVRRALVVSLVTGTLVAAINHWHEIAGGAMGAALAWQLSLTYGVPFLVSLVSSVLAARDQRRHLREMVSDLERRIEIFARLPDANPNPVLRLATGGELLYANASSAPLVAS